METRRALSGLGDLVLGVLRFPEARRGTGVLGASELALWPAGTKLAAAEGWVSGLPEAKGVSTLLLNVGQGGLPKIDVNIGGRPRRLLLRKPRACSR